MTDSEETSVVMIVDDEEMVLMSIRSFLNLETSYQVLTFTSPVEALDHFARNEVDLVISDYLMPQMDGISFLGKVRELKLRMRRPRMYPGSSSLDTPTRRTPSRRSMKWGCFSTWKNPGTTKTFRSSCETGWRKSI